MKYVKYFIGLIVLLGILFIAKGFLNPTISYSSEIFVDKPIKEASAVMNDESKISQWLSGVTKMEHISGEKNTVGAVTKYTFDEEGQESTVIETITSIRPNDHVALNFVIEDVMEMDYRVVFKKQDGKTHIKSTTITKGTGLFMRSIVSFMKNSMQAQEDENMNNLKKLINENTTNYFHVPVVETIETARE